MAAEGEWRVLLLCSRVLLEASWGLMDVIRDEPIVKSDGMKVLGRVILVIVDVVSEGAGRGCRVGGSHWDSDWRCESSASRSMPWVARKAWAMIVLVRWCWWVSRLL